MKENKAVGPNLKTYYYFTNNMADQAQVKGVIIIATGMEGTGSLYDEIGDYLDSKGYAMYAIDEWGYGKTGEVKKKTGYKNWKKKEGHFAAYNIHALSVLAKSNHKDAPVYLLGNDFGAMLSLYLIKEFPEVIDKVVTIGWGAPRLQDYGFLFNSWIKKIFFYDDGKANWGHRSQNKRFAFRFESGEKYAWLTSDKSQLNKIKNAGYLDTPGTIGHYFFYYRFKVKYPCWARLKKCDRSTPMLFISGDHDLLTIKGRKTRDLVRYYKMKGFTNVESMIFPGRHELLFESNRFQVIDSILSWLNGGGEVMVKDDKVDVVGNFIKDEVKVVKPIQTEIRKSEAEVGTHPVIDVEVEEPKASPIMDFQEAEDELLINTNKENNK